MQAIEGFSITYSILRASSTSDRLRAANTTPISVTDNLIDVSNLHLISTQ